MREVFVIDKDEARKNSESAITWVSTFSNENVQWFRIPTDNKPVSDWGAFLKRKSASKRPASAADASLYYQGDEIYITDRNPAYKQWHFTKGVVIMRNEKKVVIQLSALGKVLEVVPRDISKVASGKVRSVKPKKESKKAYYLKHLRGKWYDSSGLEIEISDQYATFVRTKTRYRIIYEAQPPTMMIGRVRWELQPSKDNDRIFWTDFKNQMEWVRPGKAALSQFDNPEFKDEGQFECSTKGWRKLPQKLRLQVTVSSYCITALADFVSDLIVLGLLISDKTTHWVALSTVMGSILVFSALLAVIQSIRLHGYFHWITLFCFIGMGSFAHGIYLLMNGFGPIYYALDYSPFGKFEDLRHYEAGVESLFSIMFQIYLFVSNAVPTKNIPFTIVSLLISLCMFCGTRVIKVNRNFDRLYTRRLQVELFLMLLFDTLFSSLALSVLVYYKGLIGFIIVLSVYIPMLIGIFLFFYIYDKRQNFAQRISETVISFLTAVPLYLTFMAVPKYKYPHVPSVLIFSFRYIINCIFLSIAYPWEKISVIFDILFFVCGSFDFIIKIWIFLWRWHVFKVIHIASINREYTISSYATKKNFTKEEVEQVLSLCRKTKESVGRMNATILLEFILSIDPDHKSRWRGKINREIAKDIMSEKYVDMYNITLHTEALKLLRNEVDVQLHIQKIFELEWNQPDAILNYLQHHWKYLDDNVIDDVSDLLIATAPFSADVITGLAFNAHAYDNSTNSFATLDEEKIQTILSHCHYIVKNVEENNNWANEWLAKFYFEQGKHQEAIHFYTKALRDPRISTWQKGFIHKNIGKVYHHNSNDLHLALKHYDIGLQFDPFNSILHYHRSLVFDALGEPEKAKESCEKALEIDENYADAHGHYARLLDDDAKAKKHLKLALKADTKNIAAMVNLGQIYYKSNLKKARKWFSTAFEIDSTNLIAGRNLAVCFGRTGKLEEAEKILNDLQGVYPEDKLIQDMIQEIQRAMTSSET